MIRNGTEDARAALAADWPAWHIWYVPRAAGPMTWCARRHDDHKHVLNAGSPAQLADLLAGEPRGPAPPAR